MRRTIRPPWLGSSVPRSPALEGQEVTSSINMTPMIDVMLALLIIFMVVTPVLTDYAARLPDAVHVVPQPGEDVITIGIDAEGLVYLGNERVQPSRLVTRLQELYRSRPGDHLVYLRADRNADFAIVQYVLSAAQSAGIRTVGALVSPVPPSVIEDPAQMTPDAATVEPSP